MKSFVQIAPTDFEQQHHLAREKPAGILYSIQIVEAMKLMLQEGLVPDSWQSPGGMS
jgi:hypothetical protein